MMPIANALKELGVDVGVQAVVAQRSVNAIPREAAIGKHSLALMGASQRGILKLAIQ
jgi:hypothetical protein